MKNLLKEINRTKKLMGLPLITEGIGDLSDFFKKLFTSGVTNISPEERKILQDLISSSTELQSAGIKSIDNLLSDIDLVILRNVIINNQLAIKNSLDKVLSNYANKSISIINKNIDSVPKIKDTIKNLEVKGVNVINTIKRIESEGIENVEIDDLLVTLNQLTDAKKLFSDSVEMKTYLDDIYNEIYPYVSSKRITFSDLPESKIIETGKIKNPTRSVLENKPDGTVGEVEMPSWVWNNWWNDTDYRGSKTISDLNIKADRVKNVTFKPEEVKVLNSTTDLDGREYYELLLPTNEKVILYKSSGTGSPDLKQKGDWQIINGFTTHPNDFNYIWAAKSVDSTQYTKGGNQYFTDLSNYLKSNGDNPISLLGSKSVFSSPISSPKLNLLTTNFGDTSGIDWSKITNAKNINDYDKLIDDAMNKGDFSMISRSGFESYGIPNFREYLKNIYYNKVNPDYGTPINLPSK